MQDYDLLNPGIDQVSQTMRKNVAHCISNLEGVVELGATPDTALSLFLADAATKTPGYVEPVAPTNAVTLTDGQKVDAVSVTGTGNFATFTVVDGAITAIVLSAS